MLQGNLRGEMGLYSSPGLLCAGDKRTMESSFEGEDQRLPPRHPLVPAVAAVCKGVGGVGSSSPLLSSAERVRAPAQEQGLQVVGGGREGLDKKGEGVAFKCVGQRGGLSLRPWRMCHSLGLERTHLVFNPFLTSSLFQLPKL